MIKIAREKFECRCKYCGKTFYSVNEFKTICNDKACQYQRRSALGIIRPAPSRKSIDEICKSADWWSKRLHKTVTYGQVSLYEDTGIRVF